MARDSNSEGVLRVLVSGRRPIAASNGAENVQAVRPYGVVLRNGEFSALKAVTDGGRSR